MTEALMTTHTLAVGKALLWLVGIATGTVILGSLVPSQNSNTSPIVRELCTAGDCDNASVSPSELTLKHGSNLPVIQADAF
jgi:hypothetical protein